MPMPSDEEFVAQYREYLQLVMQGSYAELQDMAEDILEGRMTSWPREPAIEILSQQTARRLYQAFGDGDLQDLYDCACEDDLFDVAERFKAAVLARPYVDDGRIPGDVRALVMERDGHKCRSCGAVEDLTIDHRVVPWSYGGSSTDPDNLQVLCRSCNSRKGTRLDNEDE
jgi:hypothetical protein